MIHKGAKTEHGRKRTNGWVEGDVEGGINERWNDGTNEEERKKEYL